MQVQKNNVQTSFGARSIQIENMPGLGKRVNKAVNDSRSYILEKIGDETTDILIREKPAEDALLHAEINEDFELVSGELEIFIQKTIPCFKRTFLGKLKPQTKTVSGSIFASPLKGSMKSLEGSDIVKLALEGETKINKKN